MSRSDRREDAAVPDCLPLTPEEVDALPEGAPVTVIWSGGNGPHNYVITVDERDEQRYAWAKEMDHNGNLRFYNALTFVGRERFHTRVWHGHIGSDARAEGTQDG